MEVGTLHQKKENEKGGEEDSVAGLTRSCPTYFVKQRVCGSPYAGSPKCLTALRKHADR